MKKLIFLFLSFLFLTPLMAQTGVVIDHEDRPISQEKLDKTLRSQLVQPRDTHLYDFVHDQLNAYYGRADFSDPQRQTGWYRVNDFLKWLSQNEAILLEESSVMPSLTNFTRATPDDLRALWVYLGVRYVADRYKYPVNINRLFISVCTQNTCSRARQNTIIVSAEQKKPALVSDINLGMHEGTHILPFLNRKQDLMDPLSELATFYSQFHFGLPVKIKDSKDYSGGIRDFLLTYQRTGTAFNLQNEYDFYLLGRLTRLTPKQILAFYDKGGVEMRRNFSLWQNLTNLLFIADKKYLAAKDMRRFPPLSKNIGWQSTQDKDAIYSKTAYFLNVDKEWLKKTRLPIVYAGKQSINDSDPVESFIFMYADGAALRGPFYEISQDTYFKHSLGELAQRPEVLAFYKNMLNKIPSDVRQDILAQYPRMMPQMYGEEGFYADFAEKITNKHKNAFIQAAVFALQQAGVSPSPLPEGYI